MVGAVSPWNVISQDIQTEVDKIQAERDAQRAEAIQKKIGRVRTSISPYVVAARDEVLSNWEFYLTTFMGFLFMASIVRRLK